MFWYGDQVAWWGWLLMSLGMIAFWGLLVVAFVLLLRVTGFGTGGGGAAVEPPARPAPPQTPEQILAERLARGEIDPAEYAERRAALQHQAGDKVRT